MKTILRTRTIGELAAEAGLETHVLRHWEAMGLLNPQRVSGRRIYTDDDVCRVAAIQRGKAARLSLEQLRELITATDRYRRIRVLQQHRDQLQQQAAVIGEAIDMIDKLLDCDHEEFIQYLTDIPEENRDLGSR